jgi:hypothetical protein
MADGRYQAEPRFPRTQAMRWPFREASSAARDRAGQRFSTSASVMRSLSWVMRGRGVYTAGQLGGPAAKSQV